MLCSCRREGNRKKSRKVKVHHGLGLVQLQTPVIDPSAKKLLGSGTTFYQLAYERSYAHLTFFSLRTEANF